jgi:hypothetical protein
MAQNIAVGMPVEIKPGILPDVFGGGGVLTRDEYDIQDYQTNIANIEKIGSVNNPDLPAGTVLICHGQSCSIYSINHIRPYNPDENNSNNRGMNAYMNRANNSNVSTPRAPNNRNNKNRNASVDPATENGGFELFGVKLFGGRRRRTMKRKASKKTRKHRRRTARR